FVVETDRIQRLERLERHGLRRHGLLRRNRLRQSPGQVPSCVARPPNIESRTRFAASLRKLHRPRPRAISFRALPLTKNCTAAAFYALWRIAAAAHRTVSERPSAKG